MADQSLSVDEVSLIIDFQRVLMNLGMENFEEYKSLILQTPWMTRRELVPRFVHTFLLASIYRPYSSPLTKFLASLIEAIPPDFAVKTSILSTLWERLTARSYTSMRAALCRFLFYCVVDGIFSISEIVNSILSFQSDSTRFETIAFNTFVWLAPELEKQAPAFFSICESILELMQVSQNLYPTVRRFLFDLPKLRENDWFSLNQRRTSNATLNIFSAIFKRNDLEKLLQLSVHPSFNIDQIVAPSIFEPSFFVSNAPTLIEFAGFCGAVDCFEFFIENLADRSLTDANGVGLRDFVVAGGCRDVIGIWAQVDPDVSESNHLLAQFHYPGLLISAKSFLAAATSDNVQVLVECLKEGIDVNSVDEKNRTPVIIAAQYGHIDTLRLVLGTGLADVNRQDVDLMTALQHASQNGFVDVVKLLLSVDGIDVNKPHKFGMTPLHWAAQKGFVEIGDLLLARTEIQVNATDEEGWTALMWASNNGRLDFLAHLLVKHEIDVTLAQQVSFLFLMDLLLFILLQVTDTQHVPRNCSRIPQ
jgi:hypothetical protein